MCRDVSTTNVSEVSRIASSMNTAGSGSLLDCSTCWLRTPILCFVRNPRWSSKRSTWYLVEEQWFAWWVRIIFSCDTDTCRRPDFTISGKQKHRRPCNVDSDIFPRITMYVAYILLNACRSGTGAFNTTIYLFFHFTGLKGFVSKLYLLVYLIWIVCRYNLFLELTLHRLEVRRYCCLSSMCAADSLP
jgi:hypothetical protein